MESDDADQSVPLPWILIAVSTQLAELAAQMARLEEIVGPSVVQKPRLSDDLICELQALDRVHQSIEDIATLTGHLSEHVTSYTLSPADVEAIEKTLLLSSTKLLLRSNPKCRTTFGLRSKPSELDLF